MIFDFDICQHFIINILHVLYWTVIFYEQYPSESDTNIITKLITFHNHYNCFIYDFDKEIIQYEYILQLYIITNLIYLI